VLNVLFYDPPVEAWTFRDRVNAVTVDDVQRVACLKPDNLSVVLVAPRRFPSSYGFGK
jgi:predicted Zn-dependent peptidase